MIYEKKIGGIFLADETIKQKPKKSGELIQLLVSVAVIGALLLVEIWLLFFYREGYTDGFVFPLIFGILTILMTCILTLNIYQIFVKKMAMSAGSASDKKAEYLIYKEVKNLPDAFENQLKEELKTMNEEFSKTQMKTAKAILVKMEEKFLENAKNSSSEELIEQFNSMKNELDGLKNELEQVKAQNESLTNQLNSGLNDHENIKSSFAELQNDHKKVFDLLGSLVFRNDEINEKFDKFTILSDNSRGSETFAEKAEEKSLQDMAETIVDLEIDNSEIADSEIDSLENDNWEIDDLEDDNLEIDDSASNFNIDENADPNKQLSPEEIAAMFANV